MKAVLIASAILLTLAIMTSEVTKRPSSYLSGVSVLCNDMCK